MKDKIYLVDGYGLIYKSYYAFIRNPVINSRGRNLSAVFGFFRSLFSLLKSENPVHIAVAMDDEWPTFRHELYKEYKANREKTPRDLTEQIEPIEEILKHMGIPVIRKKQYEADDIIGTLSAIAVDKGMETLILSSDKDLMQLVCDDVKMIKPLSGSFEVLGPQEVFESKGVEPSQIIDFLSLTGDASDNIPGVKGIGEKSAQKLLKEFSTLDGIYESLEKITAKAQYKKLSEQRDSAYFSKELVKIKMDVPVDIDPASLHMGKSDDKEVISAFRELEMKSLVKTYADYRGINNDDIDDLDISPKLDEHSSEKVHYSLVTTEKELDTWLDKLRNALYLSLDTETDSTDAMRAELAGISLSLKPQEACYIPVRAPEGSKLIDEKLLKEKLTDFFSNRKARLVGQNLKYDKKVLLKWGVDIGSVYFDTMVASWLLDTASRHSLDNLANKYLNYKMISYSDAVEKGKCFRDVELEDALKYAAEDADITLRIFEKLRPLIEERGMEELFYNLEMPLIDILVTMEMNGIFMDRKEIDTLSVEMKKELKSIKERVTELVGKDFNIRSTKQLQEILFTDLQLPVQKKTKTGYSTDTSVLTQLAAIHPVPELILRHRELSKLKSSYVDKLPGEINPETGRIHTNFLINGTATGRLSCSDPNLQNIPVRSEQGRRIRTAFKPADGMVLLSADYSQIELVMLAHLSGDEGLVNAFKTGVDIHNKTASLLFHKDEKDIDSKERSIAKTINFGVLYGMSGYRLSRELKIPRREADSFIESYFEQYRGIRIFLDKTVENAERDGGVYTLSGRFRSIPAINSRNKTERKGAARMALNTVIQGSAADIVKQAMVDIYKKASDSFPEVKMLLQVHDEIIFELPESSLDRFSSVLVDVMENVKKLDVPLNVKYESGMSWGDFH